MLYKDSSCCVTRIPTLQNIPMSFRNLALHPALNQPFSINGWFLVFLVLFFVTHGTKYLLNFRIQVIPNIKFLIWVPVQGCGLHSKRNTCRLTAVNPKGKCSRISKDYINISSL